jgi:hypothetical protein
MENDIGSIRRNTIAALRRAARARAAEEQCDWCNLALAPVHRHLLEVATRQIVCACDGCALRFQSVAGGRFKLIPRDARALPGFCMTGGQWEGLALPINLAFFFHDSTAGKVTAMYPSPAGATESLLSLGTWETLVAANPALAEMEPDVEALLVNRVAPAKEHFIAPIDHCYELTGLIRTHWRGFSGGETVWEKIGTFFTKLRQESGLASQLPEVCHA